MSKSDTIMYITSGFFSILLKQFENIQIDVPKIFAKSGVDPKVLKSSFSKINADILGEYLEQVVFKTGNSRIGLETGFRLPFSVVGTMLDICRNYSTPRELFASNFDFEHPTENGVHELSTKEKDDLLYYEIYINKQFEESYPIAAKQWLEMQYGIALQYAYSLTGRYLYPVSVHSIYAREGDVDKLTEYFNCPIKYQQGSSCLIFSKDVLDIPIIETNKELLPIFEDYMNEIQVLNAQQNQWSNSVRRYLLHNLSNSDLSLDIIARKHNMSKRNLHRKLKDEKTSYQQILDSLRIELSSKYLKEKISLVEIAFLLGFTSQSAFNKFFQKHFNMTPGQFR